MKVLAIESSCDETGVAIVEKNEHENSVSVLSNVTATSLALHAKTGGIIPENAAREQAKVIIPTLIECLLRLNDEQLKTSDIQARTQRANEILRNSIDAIAVTHGPGLIGSLLVGVETAKSLAFAFEKPIIPVNHLLAHIFANFISNENHPIPQTPFIGLIISGGHTDLLYFEDLNTFTWLGGTRDDAAGEALDKIGRLLELSYPAGPEIEERAKKVTASSLKFQSPLINSPDFDFSFSGLKTELLRYTQKNQNINSETKNEACFAVQNAIFDVIIKKAIEAAKKYNTNTIVLGGGVSANKTLLERFNDTGFSTFAPRKEYSTDNAAMIGAYVLMQYKPQPWNTILATPNLYFSKDH